MTIGGATLSRRRPVPGAVTGDLSTIAGARTVADQVNKLGRFDGVIHNAGIGYREGRVDTEPGVPSIFAVNVLVPFMLTALIEKPDRLVYLSSGTHHGVRPRMDDLLWTKRSWSGFSAYAESKLCDVLLAFAIARRWKDVKSNALEPGWVATKMAAAQRRTIFSKAVSPKRGWPRARTSWRNRPAGISIINAVVHPTRLRATSGPRSSYSRSAIGSLASLLIEPRPGLQASACRRPVTGYAVLITPWLSARPSFSGFGGGGEAAVR